jgi:hypothetical protein
MKAWALFRCSHNSYISGQISIQSPRQSIGRYPARCSERNNLTDTMHSGICSACCIQSPLAWHYRLNGFLQDRLNGSYTRLLHLVSAEVGPVVLDDELKGP